MTDELLSSLAPRLRALGEGGYDRVYVRGGRTERTGTHQLLADILDALKVPYERDVDTGRAGAPRVDFVVNGTLVFVEREVSPSERKALSATKADCVMVQRDAKRSDRADHGIRVLGLGEEGGLQTIFLDDPSFAFDYAHILPKTEKCSVMHGHTSSVLVELIGSPLDGMVVDFAVAKEIVREATRSLDHKLFISERYVTKSDRTSVELAFETVHGDFSIRAPKATTVLLGGEATVENLAKELLRRVAPKMPENVAAVGVYVYEGLNKGSHILARIHQSGGTERRRRR